MKKKEGSGKKVACLGWIMESLEGIAAGDDLGSGRASKGQGGGGRSGIAQKAGRSCDQ